MRIRTETGDSGSGRQAAARRTFGKLVETSKALDRGLTGGFMQAVNDLHTACRRKFSATYWMAGSCAGFALPRKKFVVYACESDRGQGSGDRDPEAAD